MRAGGSGRSGVFVHDRCIVLGHLELEAWDCLQKKSDKSGRIGLLEKRTLI